MKASGESNLPNAALSWKLKISSWFKVARRPTSLANPPFDVQCTTSAVVEHGLPPRGTNDTFTACQCEVPPFTKNPIPRQEYTSIFSKVRCRLS